MTSYQRELEYIGSRALSFCTCTVHRHCKSQESYYKMICFLLEYLGMEILLAYLAGPESDI